MFTVIYAFHIKPDQDASFIEAWKQMTLLIREFEGGLGSRLHKASEHRYLAYAQWPDRDTWENSGSHLPPVAETYRNAMRAACEKTETLHTLDVVEDLLIQ